MMSKNWPSCWAEETEVGLWSFQSGWNVRGILWKGGNHRDVNPKLCVQFLLETVADFQAV